MGERRGSQFVVEAVFLIALATALAFAHLHAYEIAGGMLLGWLVVALLEWATWRGRPHYGSGVPPRYYVPSVSLPPAQPLEQVAVGYPEATRDEAPTWIASAELRSELLGEWPVSVVPVPAPEEAPVAEADEEEEEEPEFVAAGVPDADPWTVAELPAEPGAGFEPPAEGEPIEVPARPRGVRALPGSAAPKE